MNKFENGAVYHYTSPEGIYSILSKKTLWFTDAQYLNDKSENSVPNDDMERYVLSTSLDSDDIALWNYYVKNSFYLGYNLGIDIKSFVSHLNNDIHRESPLITLEHGEVEYVCEEAKNEAKGNLFVKSNAFSCEKEYRFVLSVPKDFPFKKDHTCALKKNLKFVHKFRMGNSGVITPYIEWKFTLSEKEDFLTRITLAPMIEKELAVASFERFLDTQVQRRIKVVSSSINVRF